ncbi:MAG: TIGR03862 family flavoprotein [Paracoccaceae bacterium]
MTVDVLVIGAGPAGLMAADQALRAGCSVIVAEAKPSVGRKFLMAGKSGLNLTKDENFPKFVSHYAESAPFLTPILRQFGPVEVMDWARSLGQEVFTGSTGRVFPKVMKASPLLRAWLADLADRGLTVNTRWRWCGPDGDGQAFDTPDGRQILRASAVVFAMGGGSWARLGSDGAWAPALSGLGLRINAFQPANFALRVDWSSHMTASFGAPLKSIALRAGVLTSRGEVTISAKGLEGGGLYPLGPALRAGLPCIIDLFPDQSAQTLATRLALRPAKESATTTLRKALNLSGARLAFALEAARPFPAQPADRALALKSLVVPNAHPAPLDEAISTAGGLALAELDESLMISNRPGFFAAGEMMDWEAPTGGYLLTACLATGRVAGKAAARWSGRDA